MISNYACLIHLHLLSEQERCCDLGEGSPDIENTKPLPGGLSGM